MSYPDRKYIYEVFSKLAHPPNGVKDFFEFVDDNIRWEVTGQHRFSGVWTNKAEYYQQTWANINDAMAGAGFKLEVPGGEQGIIVGQDGWAAVELKAVDMKTKKGKPYRQHYSWHCRFNTEGRIVEVKAFLDSDLLEKVFVEG